MLAAQYEELRASAFANLEQAEKFTAITIIIMASAAYWKIAGSCTWTR